ncbi:MAG TPA: hypothetical protein VKA70_06055 [Blastocatellia bacterium]|nr:hypothetical protein [Blastocatellia bacterium]
MYFRTRDNSGRTPRQATDDQRSDGSVQGALSGIGKRIRIPPPVARAAMRLVERPVQRVATVIVRHIPGLPRRVSAVPAPIIRQLFNAVVVSNLAQAKQIKIPDDYKAQLLDYAKHNKKDGIILRAALARLPRFFVGGWVPGRFEALAVTLDTRVFCAPHIIKGGTLPIGIYAHEMVHVTQYGLLGVPNFLSTYFRVPVVRVLRGLLSGQKLKTIVQNLSNQHEDQANAIERRFCAWYENKTGLPCY